jgi:hypothetical protein
MRTKVSLLGLSATISAALGACQIVAPPTLHHNATPRVNRANAGAPLGPGPAPRAADPACAPFAEAGEAPPGTSYICEGQGSGWFVADIVGLGERTTCLKGRSPNCSPVAFASILFDVPRPRACCKGPMDGDAIRQTCAADCGYAGCKIAVAMLRASADSLRAPRGLARPYATAKADLHAFADALEQPAALRYCAAEVALGAGQAVALEMEGSAVNRGRLGHIKSATLYIACVLDARWPYTVDAGVGVCAEPTNIPVW